MSVTRSVAWACAVAALACGGARGAESVKFFGYLEYRKGSVLIVDAQRVIVTAKTKVHLSGGNQSIPLGYELLVQGERAPDGSIIAKTIEAKPNGLAFMEKNVLQQTEQAEQAYVKAAKMYEAGADGKATSMGNLLSTGPQVDRCRKIVDRLLPAYVDPKNVRVYVVENPEWNAMAMANYSIYTFSGLMKDLDDDELAIVLGHEIAHASHEHSRRQAKKSVFGNVAGQAAMIGASFIGSDLGRTAAQQATAVGVTTYSNFYSRDYEDQADRVGLRYVYEAGYDVHKAPPLWRKFAAKYGDGNKAENFFFGDHSLSAKRASDLEKEIAHNYADPAKDPPSRAGGGR
ncbi:MAG TPA: M48 family metalloprotease [Candidatus Polarisedimenticolaceae bacterium]|nr:M48 family metalloprotease [Candidatus Polarisedimenticolaceae bacterium]